MMTIMCFVKNNRQISVGDEIEYKSDRYGIVRAKVIMLGQKFTYDEKVKRDIIKVHTKKNSKMYYSYITTLRNTDNITKVE